MRRLWQSESRDDGATWSPPRPSDFSDNATKYHFGRLPDGRSYYVGCPDPEPRWTRSPLVLSLFEDGVCFKRHYILADHHTPYEQRAPGLHVIVSRRKEAVDVLRVPLATIRYDDLRARAFCCHQADGFRAAVHAGAVCLANTGSGGWRLPQLCELALP